MPAARYDLPLGTDVTGRFLPWIIAVMVYLATLAMAGAMAVSGLVDRWDAGLSGTVTVEISPPSGTGTALGIEESVAAALGILRSTQGVASADPLSQDRTQALLAPWLGDAALLEDLPVPVLIDVRLDAPVDLRALSERLAAAVPGAMVDDHQAWLDDLLDLARGVEMLAAGIVLLVAGAAIGTVVFVARAGLAIHAQVVELLHLMGAPDTYVARQFQRHVLGLAVKGSAAGAALALLTLLPFGFAAGGPSGAAELLPVPSLSSVQWMMLLAVPLLASALAAVAARLTVLRALMRLP
jgi:cell division transport system permease protein